MNTSQRSVAGNDKAQLDRLLQPWRPNPAPHQVGTLPFDYGTAASNIDPSILGKPERLPPGYLARTLNLPKVDTRSLLHSPLAANAPSQPPSAPEKPGLMSRILFGHDTGMATTPILDRVLAGSGDPNIIMSSYLGAQWANPEEAAERIPLSNLDVAGNILELGGILGGPARVAEAVRGVAPLARMAGVLGPIGRAARLLRPASEAVEVSPVAKFLSQGFRQPQAERLAELYDGMGHHFLPRRWTWVPKWYMDSPLNVLKPKGISKGDFYELHYMVDPKMNGARLNAVGRGSGWSGRRLGLKRYGLLGRLWFGSPPPLKLTVGGIGAAGSGGVYLGTSGDDTDSYNDKNEIDPTPYRSVTYQ